MSAMVKFAACRRSTKVSALMLNIKVAMRGHFRMIEMSQCHRYTGIRVKLFFGISAPFSACTVSWSKRSATSTKHYTFQLV